ncbi:hypothetical protein K490DRAFT_60982 [Saccharata proteae CBS 121410]|uniref:CFEM domain-containing protein n=1 Tax=Saccharata proteae CBS 121410 TaxID=1314787 RepID=A0A9P4I2K4_9PEZI|nr:hypothetical protein K490DRAFT_60982 [Saccharata proteae CBS 121410]
MKSFSVVAALSLAVASVSAQAGCLSSALSLIPACGQQCLLSAQQAVGCTVETDFACGCSNSAKIMAMTEVTSCVLASCTNIQTALQVQSGAVEICQCVKTAAVAPVASTTADMSSAAMSSAMASSMPSSMAAASSMMAASSEMMASSAMMSASRASSAAVAGTPGATPSSTPAQVSTAGAASFGSQFTSFGSIAGVILAIGALGPLGLAFAL